MNPSISGVAPDRLGVRYALLAGLALALLVPLLLVGGVSAERQRYQQEAADSVAVSYGAAQRLAGPVLIIPARDRVTEMVDGVARVHVVDSVHAILPEQLSVTGTLTHEYRARGIYQVPVYRAALRVQGRFPVLTKRALERADRELLWEQAFVAVGISDPRAIRSAGELRLGDRTLSLAPGTSVPVLGAGVRAVLPPLSQPGAAVGANTDRWMPSVTDPVAAWAGAEFELALTLAGTGRLAVLPLGDSSEIELTSPWPHPRFEGDFLPLTRTLGPGGFRARWQVSALARGVPHHFSLSESGHGLPVGEAAVSLFEPVNEYVSVDRAVKYGALFIALTFLAVACAELYSGQRFHLLQYGVTGIALVLFYLVLLSLSEQMPFARAYVLATTVIVLMLGGYAWGITASRSAAALFAVLLLSLYATLYVLLRLEDFALLAGTGVLLVALAALMSVTAGARWAPSAPRSDALASRAQ
ncbi:MAG: cell envelope integrity protein CreD [Pseudomonadota bacterium]